MTTKLKTFGCLLLTACIASIFFGLTGFISVMMLPFVLVLVTEFIQDAEHNHGEHD